MNNSNNLKEEELIYKLYKKIFGNIIISKLIYHYVGLYLKNKNKTFNTIRALRGYKEREYIESLYICDTENDDYLEIGDLPIDGVLKEVRIKNRNLLSKCVNGGNVIPFGVRILKFDHSNINQLIQTPKLSALPSSIDTIENAIFCNYFDSSNNEIPSNIKSISFYWCPNISNNNDKGNGFIKIPNTIRKLEFGDGWTNEGLIIRKGDIPFGVTSLSLENATLDIGDDVLPESLIKLSISYNFNNNNNIDKIKLPNSLKYLVIDNYSENLRKGYGELDQFIPPNILELKINTFSQLSSKSNFYKCNWIKKLGINLIQNFNKKIGANSLPSSITHLEINGISILEINTIPNSVTSLKLTNNNYDNINNLNIQKGALPNSITKLIIDKFINENEILPESLIQLEILESPSHFSRQQDFYNQIFEKFNQMLPILPKYLKTIILPKQYNYIEKKFNYKIPKSINLIFK